MVKKIWCLLAGLILTCTIAMPAVSQTTGLMVGTVLDVRDENSMIVDITGSNVPGIQGATLILLPKPVPMKQLIYFQGKQLSFTLLGYDILGRPICNAYYNGIPIDNFDLYNRMRYNRYYYNYYNYYSYYSSY